MKGVKTWWLTLGCVGLLAWPALAAAQEYLLGPEDVIAVSVYLHPELERTLSVDAEGNITFPPIGSHKAAGLTPKQLGDKLAERLASYLRQTTAVTVTVTQYLSRSVYVQGGVAKPGRYGFERIPGLIEVIGQAGGASPSADLSRVEISRREGAGRKILYANAAASLRDGNASSLPKLEPGDIITIPGGLGTAAGGSLTSAADGVAVLGEVAKPGIYPVGAAQDLWSVLAVAGGITQRGDLSKVRILTRDGATQTVVMLNLKQALERGSRRPQVVKAGDVVYVTPTGSSKMAQAFVGFQAVLAISRDLLNIYVLSQLIDDNNNINP